MPRRPPSAPLFLCPTSSTRARPTGRHDCRQQRPLPLVPRPSLPRRCTAFTFVDILKKCYVKGGRVGGEGRRERRREGGRERRREGERQGRGRRRAGAAGERKPALPSPAHPPPSSLPGAQAWNRTRMAGARSVVIEPCPDSAVPRCGSAALQHGQHALALKQRGGSNASTKDCRRRQPAGAAPWQPRRRCIRRIPSLHALNGVVDETDASLCAPMRSYVPLRD